MPFPSRALQLSCIVGLLLASIPGATIAQDSPLPRPASPSGLYVAVGYGGRRVVSHDGKTWGHEVEWAANGGDDNNCLFSVAFARDRFVAVGGGASVGHILTTRDGREWKEVYRAKTRVVPVVYGNDRFVVGSGRGFLSSVDGETWTPGGTLDYQRGIYFRRAAFGNGVFVFCGDCDIAPNTPRNGWRCTISDGVKIEAFASDIPNTRSIAFGAGRFVIVGEKGSRHTSVDGKAWESSPDPDEDFHWVFWTGDQFLLNGSHGRYTSPDGKSWTKAGPSIPCHSLCTGPGGFVGASWKTNLWFSADGQRWDRTTTAGTNAITACAFGIPDRAEDVRP